MSDECERLFSSAKILLSDRRSRLKIDIIEASECLRSWYGPPVRNTFEDTNIGKLEGESDLRETYQAGDESETKMNDEFLDDNKATTQPQEGVW
ncbi:hypothetical protein HIM_05902 [Hirsutella minnesotensis 3608]|nr:hypothetical protein HIM_05902 [Hirsutella minnesotensis 3608]